MWSGWLEGSISRSSLQFHFLQTLEHRTDVPVTSTSLGGKLQRSRECPGCQPAPMECAGVPPAPHAVLLLSPGVSPAPGWLVPVLPSWHHLVPQASLVQPCSLSSPPACPGPTGLGNLWICGSETPTELQPSECSLLLPRLELKGDGLMCWPFSNPMCPTSAFCFPKLESVCYLLQLHL